MKEILEISSLYRYGRTICTDDWVVDDDIPTYHRIYYIYKGEAVYEDVNGKIRLASNNLYIFSSIRKYTITHNPNDPLECLWFHVNFNHVVTNDIIKLIILSDTTDYYTIKLLEKLVKNYDVLSIENAINILITQIESKIKISYVNDTRIQDTLEYIHNNYNQNITIILLAKLINVDQRYFIRLFKKNCGVTPKQYLQQYRVFMASQLLRSDYRVYEVAGMVGFQDAKAFSRFFKKQQNISPSEYKERYFLQP